MGDIPPDVEQRLASMDEGAWAAFTARVRAPDVGEEFREVASRYISGDRLEALCGVVHVGQYVSDDGQIDAAKVERHLRAMFDDLPPAGPRQQNFGQFTEQPDMGGPDSSGRAEARKRFSGQQSPPSRGNAGYEEAQRRFKQNGAR